MRFKKKNKIHEEVLNEFKNIIDNEKEQDELIQEIEKSQEIQPKKIKVGSKVVVNGRLFGNSKLEAPMNHVSEFETKILDIKNGNYKTSAGWISIDSIK